MRPDPNGNQRGRPLNVNLGKMPNRSKAQSITHSKFTPPNNTERVGISESKSGGEPGGPKRQRGKTSIMPEIR